jgi:hypothetical protein
MKIPSILICCVMGLVAQTQKEPERWWESMDYGPFLSSSVGCGKARTAPAVKGLTIRLGERQQLSMTFDTDLLRPAFGWEGFLKLTGVTYDEGHGSFPYADGRMWFRTEATAGAGLSRELKDDRAHTAGPIPFAQARWRALHRHGRRVALRYEVDEAEVLEAPWALELGGQLALVRDFRLEPCASHRWFLLADAALFGAVSERRVDGGNAAPTVILSGDNACTLEVVDSAAGKRLLLAVPATRAVRRLRVAVFAPGTSVGNVDPGAPLDPKDIVSPGKPLWPRELVVPCEMGHADAPFAVDSVGIPMENPWKSPMRLGGFDLFPGESRAAVTTWNGDVWLVSGLGAELRQATWRRFAAGLFEPLGLVIRKGRIFVSGRDQITELIDHNDDGEADEYRCFNNELMATTNFHEFVFDLQLGPEGDFWFAKAGPVRPGGRGFDRIIPHHGSILRVSEDGSALSVHATGLRAPNGIGVGPHGEITAGDNQGTWVPRCKLHWTRPGSFQGVVDCTPLSPKPTNYELPLCWFPMEVDNSSGGQVWTRDERFGLPKESLVHLSYGQSTAYRVLMETVDGQVQGGVTRLPFRLASSAMRARMDERDGQMWISGLRGWQTNAAKLSGLQRIRRTQAPLRMAESLRALEDGVEIRFTCALDPEIANDPESWSVKIWNYVWGPMYGGPELSVLDPDATLEAKARSEEMHDLKNHDTLSVEKATLAADGRSVRLRLKPMHPCMQMHIAADLSDKSGTDFKAEIWNTIHKLGRSTGN